MSSPAQLSAERLRRPHPQTHGKRKRVSIACKRCRMRKARCDGGQPKCTACVELDSNCHYEQPRVQQTSSADDQLNLDLEKRLRTIEERLNPSESNQHLENQSPQQQQPGIMDERNFSGMSSPMVNRTWTNRPAHFGRTLSPGFQEDRVDGMGAVAPTDAKELNEFYGASSNISFLNLVTEAMELATSSSNFSSSAAQIPIESSWSPEDMLYPNTEETVAPLDEQSPASSTVDLFALPSPTESDTLVRLYFSAVGLMIPCIPEGPFLETCRQVRKMGTRSARRSWLGLFNMILAMAANITTPTSPTKERARDSEMYFNRALEFAKPLIFGSVTLETVQLLLLMASYLHGTPRAAQTWTFHGIAVKGAYQLGLHSPAASRMLPLIDREIRNRTWRWCIFNDRLLSATLGRPCLIPQSHVRIGELEGVPIANSVTRFGLSSIAFFDACTSLSYIMGGVVDQLYDQNLGFGTHLSIDDTLCRTFKLRLNLAQWQQTLPPDLRIIKSTDPPQIFSSRLENTRFRVFLSLCYLSIQILVLRPILQRFLDIPMVKATGELRLSPLRDYGFSALRDLVNTCIDIFFISNNILAGSNRNLNLGAWWFSGYYTFNASLAILGVLLVEKTNLLPELFLSLSVAEMRTSLSNALDILRGLDNGNTMISKCQTTLKRLLHDYDKLEPTTPEHATSFSPTHVPTASGTNLGSVNLYSQVNTNASLNMDFGTFGGFTIDTNHNFFNLHPLDS